MKVRMKKTRVVRELPYRVAKGLVNLGDAEWYKEEKPAAPPKKQKSPRKSPFYDNRQMRVGKKHYQRKIP